VLLGEERASKTRGQGSKEAGSSPAGPASLLSPL
jgi:hypothetical protein